MSGIAPTTETINSAVARSGLCRSTIYNLMRDGALASTKVRGRRLVVSASLNNLLLGDVEQAA
jgi:hypothetical protein